jgi:tetratricopeptide (TPR) repeat protein
VEEGSAAELEAACRPLQLYYIQRGGMAGEGAAAFGHAADRLDASDVGHHQALGRLRAAEAWFRFLLNDLPGSRAAAEESMRFLGPLQREREAAEGDCGVIDRAVASARNTLGNVAKRRGDLAAAEEHFNAAMALARRQRNAPQVAIFTNNLAILKKDLGEFDEAERLYREAIASNRSLGNVRSVVRNLTNLGALLVHAGDTHRAERTLHEGLELANDIGYAEIEPIIVMNLGGAAHIAGRYEDAERLYREALRRGGPDATSAFACMVHSSLGRTATARGDWTTARDEYRRVLEGGSVRDERPHVTEALIGVCELYVKSGEPCRAVTILARIPEEASLTPDVADRMRWVDDEIRRAPCDERDRDAPRASTRAPGARLEDAVAAALQEPAAP